MQKINRTKLSFELISKLIGRLFRAKTREINYAREVNHRVISEIENKLFHTGEINNDGTSSYSTLVRRTLAQFLGQRYWKITTIWEDVLSVLALPFCLVFPVLRRILHVGLYSKKQRGQVVCFAQADFYKYFIDNIFPMGYVIASVDNQRLYLKDFKFILRILRTCPRYLLCPQLLCRVVIRISQYSYIISEHRPKKICNFAEGSCWSSVLTAYCREYGVEHVNIMHGIRFYSSRMAFSEFDTFYAWGEYHIEELRKMNTSAMEFIISGNPIHRNLRKAVFNSSHRQSHRLLVMFEPILLEENILFSLLCKVVAQVGSEWEIACRFHYQEIKQSYDFVNKLKNRLQREIIFEHPDRVSLGDSISNADAVVGCYTNALTDAWIAGRKCVYLHITGSMKIPRQEYHESKNIMIFKGGDDIRKFVSSPFYYDESEMKLQNRFSKFIV